MSNPALRDVPPPVQAIFDAINSYMTGSQWTGVNASASHDGSGIVNTISCNDNNDPNNYYNFTIKTAGVKISVTPLSVNLGPGQSQQFTAAATNPDGSPINSAKFDWTIGKGGLGTVDSKGLYKAPVTVAAASYDTVTCTIEGQNSWSSVTVQLHP